MPRSTEVLVRFGAVADPQFRLFCFPWAGGGASIFRSWAPLAAHGVDVRALQAPGRESRIATPPLEDFATLVALSVQVIAPLCDRPFMLFGHSLGAIVAYETARRLEQAGLIARRLVVSAHRAPQLPLRRARISDLPASEFIAALITMNARFEAIAASPELLDLVLPALRADFRIADEYAPASGPQLSCPVLAMGGANDPYVSHDELAAWNETTSAESDVRLFTGGHFFIESERAAVMAAIVNDRDFAPAPVRPECAAG